MKLALALLSCCALLVPTVTWTGDKPVKPKVTDKTTDSSDPAIDAPDVADIPTADLRLRKDERRRYLLAGPRPSEKQPKAGYGLLVVLPGGNGGAAFHPFVKRIYKQAVPDGWLVVQPVATQWTPEQKIVWPTEKSRVDGMQFTTEEFVAEIVAQVVKTRKIDATRVHTLSWSSSGPVAYMLAAEKKPCITGSLIAMSVFHPQDFDIANAKDRNYYILHSPEDKTCPFKLAEEARDALKKAGARVEFATYEGGHGWHGDVFGNLRAGFTWLDQQHTPR